jgi:hypothetical protein
MHNQLSIEHILRGNRGALYVVSRTAAYKVCQGHMRVAYYRRHAVASGCDEARAVVVCYCICQTLTLSDIHLPVRTAACEPGAHSHCHPVARDVARGA